MSKWSNDINLAARQQSSPPSQERYVLPRTSTSVYTPSWSKSCRRFSKLLLVSFQIQFIVQYALYIVCCPGRSPRCKLPPDPSLRRISLRSSNLLLFEQLFILIIDYSVFKGRRRQRTLPHRLFRGVLEVSHSAHHVHQVARQTLLTEPAANSLKTAVQSKSPSTEPPWKLWPHILSLCLPLYLSPSPPEPIASGAFTLPIVTEGSTLE